MRAGGGQRSEVEGAEGAVGLETVSGLEDEAAGAVLAKGPDLLLLEEADALGGVIRPHHVGRVEDVAQIVAAKAIGAGEEAAEGRQGKGRLAAPELAKEDEKPLPGVGVAIADMALEGKGAKP